MASLLPPFKVAASRPSICNPAVVTVKAPTQVPSTTMVAPGEARSNALCRDCPREQSTVRAGVDWANTGVVKSNSVGIVRVRRMTSPPMQIGRYRREQRGSAAPQDHPGPGSGGVAARHRRARARRLPPVGARLQCVAGLQRQRERISESGLDRCFHTAELTVRQIHRYLPMRQRAVRPASEISHIANGASPLTLGFLKKTIEIGRLKIQLKIDDVLRYCKRLMCRELSHRLGNSVHQRNDIFVDRQHASLKHRPIALDLAARLSLGCRA